MNFLRNNYGLEQSVHRTEASQKEQRRREQAILDEFDKKEILHGDPFMGIYSKIRVKEVEVEEVKRMEEAKPAPVHFLELDSNDNVKRQELSQPEQEAEPIPQSEDSATLAPTPQQMPVLPKKSRRKVKEVDPLLEQQKEICTMNIMAILKGVDKAGLEKSAEELKKKKLQPKPKYQRKRKAYPSSSDQPQALVQPRNMEMAPSAEENQGAPSKMLRYE